MSSTTSIPPAAAWLVAAFGDERDYSGNAGYEDVHGSTYRYDDDVPNHRQVAEGDLLVVRSRSRLEGVACIARIEANAIRKTHQRCPECATTNVRERRSRQPRFRCKLAHEFERPIVEESDAVLYSAYFDGAYVAAPALLSLVQLREVCSKWSQQLAMQRVDLVRLLVALRSRDAIVADQVEALAGPLPPSDSERVARDW